MNRRAKRNKYRKLQTEYNILKNDFSNYKAWVRFSENSKKLETVTISAMSFKNPFLDAQCVIPEEELNKIKEKEVAQNIVNNLLSNKHYFTITENDIGTKYDLRIVIPKE